MWGTHKYVAFCDISLLCKCCISGVLDKNPSLGIAKPVAMGMRRFLSLAFSFSVCFGLVLGRKCISVEVKADILGSNPAPQDACEIQFTQPFLLISDMCLFLTYVFVLLFQRCQIQCSVFI